MTGDELRRARIKLGPMWGLNRALCAAELGRALGNTSRDPGEPIRDYERARTAPVPWAVGTAVQMMLNGSLPPAGLPAVLSGPKLHSMARRHALPAMRLVKG